MVSVVTVDDLYYINYFLAFSLAGSVYELYDWLSECLCTIFSIQVRLVLVYPDSSVPIIRCLYDCTLCIAIMIMTWEICVGLCMGCLCIYGLPLYGLPLHG